MHEHLRKAHVLYKDFKNYTLAITGRMCTTIEAAARSLGRPVQYLNSSRISKEQIARQLAAEREVQEGVICVLSCQETDRAYEAYPNWATRKLELRLRPKRCVHLYVYLLHELLGFMHVRFQTWFPFLVQIGLNGREWLARQMTKAGIAFQREGNCFPFIEDLPAAQRLMDQQLRTDWPRLCNRLVETFNPIAAQVRAPLGLSYYWTVPESEYAFDVMFRDHAALAGLYPRLIHHGITSFHCENLLRYLNHYPACFSGEVRTNSLKRVEGVRLKHWVNANSIKMYDQAGSVLRVEATINEPKDFRVLRPPSGQPEAPKKWRILRRSTADMHRRAQVSHAATERYLEAMSVVEDRTALHEENLQGKPLPYQQESRRIITALLTARNADIEQLTKLAA